MSKQTAVEWLLDELMTELGYGRDMTRIDNKRILDEIKKEAKAMEKQQSISDYCAGFEASGEGWNGEYGLKDMLDVAGEIDAEDYYNKTYGGDMSKQEEPKQYTNEELEGFEDFKKLIKPKQETLEEAAERLYPISKGGSMWMPSADDCNKANKQEGFIEGAKSEAARDYWFEQFKKNGGYK